MIGALATAAAVVGITATVISFIAEELTEAEKQKQQWMRHEYNDYVNWKEEELQSILTERQITLEEFYSSKDKELQVLASKYISESKQIKLKVVEDILVNLNEHRERRGALKKELSDGIGRIRQMRKTQSTSLRQASLDHMERELVIAQNKLTSFLVYLSKYEKQLKLAVERNYDLPEPFEFLLPEQLPYNSKLVTIKKSELYPNGEVIASGCVKFQFYVDGMELIQDLDDNATIPLLVDFFDRERYAYRYSVAKGLFTYIGINQSKVGVEATVVEHDVKKKSMLLDFKGLELQMRNFNLENPRRIPPCGSVLRVFPKVWKPTLDYVEVCESYQDTLQAFNFDMLPIVFDDDDWDEFEQHLEEHNLFARDDLEWKIGPFDESKILNMEYFKFQLGTELVFKCELLSSEPMRFCFSELLDNEYLIKPDDIFVAIDATLDVVLDNDLLLLDRNNFVNMQDLVFMLHKELRIQSDIKKSQKGILYFDKWTEITDQLITYMYKGESVEIEYSEMRKNPYKDKRTNAFVYTMIVENRDELVSFVEKVSEDRFFKEYFIEMANGKYAFAEISTTADAISLYGIQVEDMLNSQQNTCTLYLKNFAYPEMMQKRALLEFRSGFVANSALKSYTLDGSNIVCNSQKLNIRSFKNKLLEINKSQKNAVIQAMNEKDMYLIQGPPGTGKTTVIKEIIYQHMNLNPSSRILIVSQANVAVDNVLRGLKDLYKDSMIRCGHKSKIDEAILDISFEDKYEKYIELIKCKNPKGVRKELYAKWMEVINETENTINPDVGELILKNHQIVGATCVGLAQKKIGLNRVIFDLVIIDEASKALPAEILIPLNRAKKIILIGDHKQLPPVINPLLYDEEKIELVDREYVKNDLFAISLFQKLYETAPKSNKLILETQYRMPNVIGGMVSELFYEGTVKNGEGTNSKEAIFFKSNLNIIDMSRDREYKEEKENGISVVNYKEAKIVKSVIFDIRKKLSPEIRIAIISPYRGQKRTILKELLKSGVNLKNQNIAVNTIDAFQGDEAEIVIYCTTRSQQKTQYFSDNARLNVAFSRAKNSLVIIGSLSYFKRYGSSSNLGKVAKYIKNHGHIYNYREFDQSKGLQKIALNMICIRDDFKKTPPAQHKIQYHVDYYNDKQRFDKPVYVIKNEKNQLELRNGYARYLAAKEISLKSIQVIVESK